MSLKNILVGIGFIAILLGVTFAVLTLLGSFLPNEEYAILTTRSFIILSPSDGLYEASKGVVVFAILIVLGCVVGILGVVGIIAISILDQIGAYVIEWWFNGK
jgi:hypothetical protein